MPAESVAQQQLFGIARAIQEGKKDPSSASGAARDIAANVSGRSVHDFAATKHKGLPGHVHHKASSVDRLIAASYILKVSDFRTALSGAEKALHKVQEVRNKSMEDFSKNLQKENDNLRKEVQNASQAAQDASDAARKVQSSSESAQAQALQMQTPGSPPAAQPPFGALAMAGAAEGTDGQQPKPAQIPSMPSGPATI